MKIDKSRHNATPGVDVDRLITGRVAVQFFLASVAVFGLAAGLAVVLHRLWPPQPSKSVVFPPAFFASTLLLLGTSAGLHRAVTSVRLERQIRFRRGLLAATILGLLFVGVQAYGLECLIAGQPPGEAQIGARPFVFVFAAMHGLHVTVALLFLTFVTVRAFAGRYDHEYHWGPLFAAWFWHALGIAWLAILGVLAISL